MLRLLSPCLNGFLGELNTLVFNFFWSGKRDLVARKVVIHPRDLGGFSVVAVQLKVFFSVGSMGTASCVFSGCLGFPSYLLVF